MNNRGNPNHPIFPSLVGPWPGYVPSTHSPVCPVPRFPYSVSGTRTHQGYVPGGVVRGPAPYVGHTSSPPPSLHTRSGISYSSSERARRMSPSVPRHLPQDGVIDADPVVFNAGFTFRMGNETHVHKHVEARPAYTVPEAQSSNLTRQIDKFLKKTDHMLDRYTAIVESRSSSGLAGRRGKSLTPGRGLDDSPDPSLCLSHRAQRSTSAASIAVKAEKHLESLSRITGTKKTAPIAEHEEDGDLDSSSSESFDEFDTDNDVLRSNDVFDISDDTSADLSKLSAIEADGDRERRASFDPLLLDDLSSDSDDEYFDVVAVPGLRPQPLATQNPTKPSTAVHPQKQQHIQPPHIPPTHSQSLPAVNKGMVARRMGSTPGQPVGTAVVNKPSETKTAVNKTTQDSSASPAAVKPTSPVDVKLTNSSVQYIPSSARISGIIEDQSHEKAKVCVPSKVGVSARKEGLQNSPKKYQAPQPPSATKHPEGKQRTTIPDKEESALPNMEQSTAPDVGTKVLPNKQNHTLLDKQKLTLPDKKPPDKVAAAHESQVNTTLNKQASGLASPECNSHETPTLPSIKPANKEGNPAVTGKDKASGSLSSSEPSGAHQTTVSPHLPPDKTTAKTTQLLNGDQKPHTSPVGRKVRAGSPVPDNTAVVGIKLAPTVVTGKLEIAASDGSATVKEDSFSENKVSSHTKVKGSDGVAEPKDNSTSSKQSSVESNQQRNKESVKVDSVTSESSSRESEKKLANGIVVDNNVKKDKVSSNDKYQNELQTNKVPISKDRENVVNHVQSENSKNTGIKNKRNAKDDEFNIDRSSRCSSVASDASRAVSPDISLRSGAKRSRSGKLAAVVNMWETDEVSQKSEKVKSKSSTPKIGKISGLASVFEGEKSATSAKVDVSKNFNKLKSPYSPPFSPERKPIETKVSNIAGISTAKFGDVTKFKKPSEPRKTVNNKNAPDTEKTKVVDKEAVKDKDPNKKSDDEKKENDIGKKTGEPVVPHKNQKEENREKHNDVQKSGTTAVKECGEKIANGDINLGDSSISVEEESKEKKRKKKIKPSTTSSEAVVSTATEKIADDALLKGSSAESKSTVDKDIKAAKVKDTESEVFKNKSKNAEAKATECKDTKVKAADSVNAQVESVGTKDIKVESAGSVDATVKDTGSKGTKNEPTESKDSIVKVINSEDTKVMSPGAKDVKLKAAEVNNAKIESTKTTEIKKDECEATKDKVTESKVTIVNGTESKPTKDKDNESKVIKVKTAGGEISRMEATATEITNIKVTDAKTTSVEATVSKTTTGEATIEKTNKTETIDAKATGVKLIDDKSTSVNTIEAKISSAIPSDTKRTSVDSTGVIANKTESTKTEANNTQVDKTGTPSCVNTAVEVMTMNIKDSGLNAAPTGLSNEAKLNTSISPVSAPVSEAVAASDTCSAKENEATKSKETVNKKEVPKKDMLGGIKSLMETVAKSGKTLEDKLSINGLQFGKKSSKTETPKEMIQTQSKNIDEVIERASKALPELETEVEALIKEASILIAKNELLTNPSTSAASNAAISRADKQSKIGKHRSTSSGEEGEDEVYVDAIDPSQLDTLMPLPVVDNERERRSRSHTPLEGPERSPSSRSVVAKTEAILSETDRILRRSRSDKSLRRSYSRTMSAAALHKLAEVTADLSEEHSTAHLAGERLEAEQAERMKLEKEVERLQTDMRHMTTANGKLEMEKQALRSEVLSVADFNGDADHDEDDAAEASLYKRKYEWCLREIELLKKQLKQQQEDDLDHLLLMKKQLEKKLSDAYEETEEQRQVVAQMKRKSQRLQAELNDLKILLEEQTSRNNLLEKKQRKFDQDMMGVQEELRHERANKEKIQRERDQILSEKYSFEQEVSTLKLELELKEEKIASLSRELEDLSFTGKVEEEVATLKKAKHDLELRVKDQEEELDDLAGQVQMLEGAKVRLEMSIEQMRKENRREVSQREEELEEVRISAQKKVKALEAQLENEHEERTLLVREKHELERRITELQDRTITHVDEDYIHKLKKELKKTKALLRDTQTMLEKSQSEGGHKLLVRQLKTQLEDAEFAKTAALKARQCADADISELSIQLEEAQRAKKESEDRCARISKDRAEVQTQLEESEEEVAEVMKKYKSVVSQLSVDQITLSEQSQQIAELEHEKQVLQERMLELTSKVEVLEGETANIHTQRRLEMKIKEIESKLELEQTTRQRLESQIGRLKDQIERISSECDSAHQKESQALEQSKKIGRQLREAKEDLSALQQKHTDVFNKKGELEKQLELADSEVITLKSDLKLAFKRIEDLQQAIQGDINDSDSDISDSDSDSDGSLSSYLTASLRHQRSSSNSTLRTPPSEVQQLDRMEQPNSPCSEAMSAISEDLDDASNKESYA
ncbi:uncharacterized protein LOC121877237 isoform X2 [Homarus americanus]|uniref:uncharacterized protein LOC121877237 isoform X2 n=1 Tax=Homarus americanus TaxID=6706 RepID=UPI001C485EFE|nr:uncharacterized protein LOC121877237 isoform X2 [Homarus americanus]